MDEPVWLRVARQELGVKEVAGNGSNPRVIEYLSTTTLPKSYATNDETPWCSAFVNWCMIKAGAKGTNSAAARSWLAWGRPIDVPVPGCVAVLSREGGGHVAFYVRHQVADLWLLGGNQANMVCERAYPPGRLLGFRMPNGS